MLLIGFPFLEMAACRMGAIRHIRLRLEREMTFANDHGRTVLRCPACRLRRRRCVGSGIHILADEVFRTKPATFAAASPSPLFPIAIRTGPIPATFIVPAVVREKKRGAPQNGPERRIPV